jgi:hypothetical protein
MRAQDPLDERKSTEEVKPESEEAADTGEKAADTGGKAADAGEKTPLFRLDKKSKVWIDLNRKLVVVEGQVVLREGQLEMFACPRSTKEHESVVSVESKAFVVHAALLAVGAKTGSPVKFAPEYTPASGTEIDIYILWVDADGKRHKAQAQDWIRQVSTDKPMPYKWVFAGSGFWVDPETGEKYYQAEDGDLICVSNFSTATLDLPVESSQSNEGLMFSAMTENIPPIGTKVRLVLIPNLKDAAAKQPADPPASEGADPPAGEQADQPSGESEEKPPAEEAEKAPETAEAESAKSTSSGSTE